MVKVKNKSRGFKPFKKRATKIIIKNTTVFKFPVKRLSIIKRRLNNLMEERSSWNATNKELSDKLSEVKTENLSLQTELVECRQRYHETMISLNSFKMRDQDVRRTIASYQFDNNLNSHLAVLSKGISKSNLTINLLKTLSSSGDQHNALFDKSNQQVFDSPMNCKQNKLTEPVGPRVKGLLISKPQEMLERVMLPDTDNQDPDSHETGADTSTQEPKISLPPIQEEQQYNETSRRKILFQRKSILGKRERTQKDKTTEDSHDSVILRYLSNTTVSKSSPTNRVVPVVRPSDVNKLLRNSSCIQMDSVQFEKTENGSNNSKETEGTLFRTSHGRRPPDDPLEGCSWMMGEQGYQGCIRKSRFNRIPLPSDSSDDDLDGLRMPVIHHYTTPCTSPLENPLLNNTAKSMQDRTYVISSAPNECTDDVEPDSTTRPNLIDDSNQFYSSPSDCKLAKPNSMSAENRYLNRISSRRQQQKKSNAIQCYQFPQVDERQLTDRSKSPEKTGKRQRKQKHWAYPVEEGISPKTVKVSIKTLSKGCKAAQGKCSVGKKSHNKLERNSLDVENISLHKSITVRKTNATSPNSRDEKSSVPLKQTRNSLFTENTSNTITRTTRSSRLSQVTTRYSRRNINHNESIPDDNGVNHQSMPIVKGLPIGSKVKKMGNSQPVKSEKKRKPKNHTNTGDKDISPKKCKVSSVRLSIGKKSTHDKRSIGRKSIDKGKQSLKENVSTVTEANLKSLRLSNINSSRPLKKSPTNLVQENTEQPNSRKPSSKRCSKASNIIRQNSNNDCNESVNEIEDSRVRLQRNKKNKSYKESPPKLEKKKCVKKKNA